VAHIKRRVEWSRVVRSSQAILNASHGGGTAWNLTHHLRRRRDSEDILSVLGRLRPEGTERESPRLGIIHFLGWITCVAVFLGVSHSVMGVFEYSAQEMSGFGLTVWGMTGIVFGTSLGGLLLFAARRHRGVTFPVYPGETLLFVKGTNAGLLALAALLLCLSSRTAVEWLGIVTFMVLLAQFSVALWATIYTDVLRWRFHFLGRTIFALAALGCGALEPASDSVVVPLFIVVALAPQICLIFAVVKDVLLRKRYPWTHWTGVAVAGGQIVIMMTMLFVTDSPESQAAVCGFGLF
jgi:hypothetical protein